jgi:hypothetical protein
MTLIKRKDSSFVNFDKGEIPDYKDCICNLDFNA